MRLERGEVFETLRELQKEGKILRWGASVESTAEAKLCLAQPGLASLQVIFNVYRQTPARVPAVICWSSMTMTASANC